MTAVVLLNELEKFVEENTKDIILSMRPAKGGDPPGKRAAEVHKMRLPDKDAETKRVPYIVLQFLTGADDQQPSDPPDCECKIRIIIATYSEDSGEGAMDVLNVITRIRIALLKAGEVGQQFLLRKPLEYIVYPEDTTPYHMGEMLTIWEMPIIQREVNIYYGDE